MKLADTSQEQQDSRENLLKKKKACDENIVCQSYLERQYNICSHMLINTKEISNVKYQCVLGGYFFIFTFGPKWSRERRGCQTPR